MPANAFFGVNSLGAANDLKFKQGFVEASSYLSSNTTFERARFRYEEIIVETTESTMEMDKDGNAEMVTRVVEKVERIPKPIEYTEPKSPAVVLLHSCGGITPKTSQDLNRWKNFLTANGYAVLVIDSLSTRQIRGGRNCIGKDRPVGRNRLVKDLFDAVAHLSTLPEIDSSRIFALGFSLGAMTAGISGDMANDRSYADKPHPRAVAGIYGGCRYRNENWLPTKSAFPILWLMGGVDLEAPPSDCMYAVKSLQAQNIGSEWHVYENATHCWDCEAMNGLTRIAGNGTSNTYLYDEVATKDSEQRVVEFFRNFLSDHSHK